MRRAFIQALFILFLLLVPIVGLWLHFSTRENSPNPTSAAPLVAARDRSDAAGARAAEETPSPTEAPFVVSPESEWEQALRGARVGRDPLAGLRAVSGALEAMNPAEAVARIQAYLRSGRDVSSGLPFALGMNGRLKTAPTLRVWLLDWLGRLDSEAAAASAQRAFSVGPGGSADEWALHLRNYAWGRAENVDTVISAAVAMLEFRPWVQAPTVGFQESFDVFVWGRDPGVSTRLVEFVSKSQPDSLRVPANLALDRLVLGQPGPVLERLFHDLGALDSLPYVRAGYFARADLDAASGQRELVADYFLDDRLSGAERDYFLDLIPNLNLTFSHNLLSENPQPTRQWGDERLDRAAAMLRVWLSDPRFGAWRTQIEGALLRIQAVR